MTISLLFFYFELSSVIILFYFRQLNFSQFVTFVCIFYYCLYIYSVWPREFASCMGATQAAIYCCARILVRFSFLIVCFFLFFFLFLFFWLDSQFSKFVFFFIRMSFIAHSFFFFSSLLYSAFFFVISLPLHVVMRMSDHTKYLFPQQK